MVKMDISRKLYKEDIILLNEIETELLRRDKRISQKDLIHKSIEFAVENKNRFLNYIFGRKKKYTREEMVNGLLSLPKVDLGENWMEEIDTIQHDDMLRRNRKK